MADKELIGLNEYQQLANRTAKYASPEYPFLLLAEEQGEVVGKLNKYARKHGISVTNVVNFIKGDPDGAAMMSQQAVELRQEVIKELGDALWAISECCKTLNLPLNVCAAANINKLADRLERNVIDGEGDNR